MKEIKSIITKFMTLLLATGMCMGLVPATTYAASTDSISVSGTYNYSMASSVLTEVNKQRTSAGVSKLTMDKTLMNEAMKRAAELSVYYSHTRPNGSGYTTAYSTLKNASSAENIAAGQGSASSVMNSWMNSSGHKKHILDKTYKSIGIGSFTNNGITYWVQVFSSKSGTSASKSGSTNTTVSVSAKSSYISGNLSLTPASSSIEKGKTTGVTAYLKNKGISSNYYKAKINASCLKWSSGSTSIATVNSSGTVTGKASGTAKITAKTSAGGTSASTTITVKNSSNSSSSSSSSKSSGSTSGSSNSNSSSSSKSSSNSSSSSSKSTSGSSSSSATKISSCTITLSKTNYTYDGKAKQPSVTVKNGSTTLKSGTDYTVSYKNNTNIGTASVVITGKGNYTGSVTKTFTISKAAETNKTKDISSCKVTLSDVCYTYDGKAKQPSVIVRDGSTTLKSGTDYTVTYTDNVNVGSGKAIITGKGNYTGSVTMSFAIKSAASSSSQSAASNSGNSNTSSSSSKASNSNVTAPATPKITSVKSPSSGAIEVKWNKVSDVTGYVLTYSTNEKFYSSSSYDTKAFDVFTKDSTSYTSSNLKKGETYYVKIQAYKTVDGKKYYSGESNVVSVKIAK